jgi:hypothetical protein
MATNDDYCYVAQFVARQFVVVFDAVKLQEYVLILERLVRPNANKSTRLYILNSPHPSVFMDLITTNQSVRSSPLHCPQISLSVHCAFKSDEPSGGRRQSLP